VLASLAPRGARRRKLDVNPIGGPEANLEAGRFGLPPVAVHRLCRSVRGDYLKRPRFQRNRVSSATTFPAQPRFQRSIAPSAERDLDTPCVVKLPCSHTDSIATIVPVELRVATSHGRLLVTNCWGPKGPLSSGKSAPR